MRHYAGKVKRGLLSNETVPASLCFVWWIADKGRSMFLIVNCPRDKTSAILFLFISISFSGLNVSHISQDLWMQITSHKGLYGTFLFLFCQKITCIVCSPWALGTWRFGFFLLVGGGGGACNYFRAFMAHFS